MQDKVKNTAVNRQSGRSMLEVIAVIAVFGIIAGGIMTMATRVFSDRANAVIISEVSHVADGAKSLLSWYPNIESESTVVMKYLLCQKYIKSSKTLSATDCGANLKEETDATGILANGSPINVTTAKGLLSNGNTCTAGTSGCFDIVTLNVSKLTKEECYALAMTEWGKDFVGMSKGDSIEYVATSSYTFPLDFANAKTFCGSADSNGKYSLKILFF